MFTIYALLVRASNTSSASCCIMEAPNIITRADLLVCFSNSNSLNIGTAKVVEMINLKFSMEILYIYDGIFLSIRVIVNKIY